MPRKIQRMDQGHLRVFSTNERRDRLDKAFGDALWELVHNGFLKIPEALPSHPNLKIECQELSFEHAMELRDQIVLLDLPWRYGPVGPWLLDEILPALVGDSVFFLGDSRHCLFDRYLWEMTDAEKATLTKEEVRLALLDAIDRDRRQFARLRRIHIDGEARRGGRVPIPEGTIAFVFRRDGGRCRVCGTDSDLQVDHIIPCSRGGGDHPDNLQILCGACNLKKGAMI